LTALSNLYSRLCPGLLYEFFGITIGKPSSLAGIEKRNKQFTHPKIFTRELKRGKEKEEKKSEFGHVCSSSWATTE
jgi:hypothetical protein